MKIGFLVESYYPRYSGVPVVVKYLAEGLAKENEVIVVTRQEENTSSEEIINNVKVYRIPGIERNFLKRYKKTSQVYVNFVKKISFDVVIIECTQAMTTDILLKELDSISGLKILHAHGFSGLTKKLFSYTGSVKHFIGNMYNYCYWNIYYKFVLPKYINHFDCVVNLWENDSSSKWLKQYYNGNKYSLGNAVDDIFFLADYEERAHKTSISANTTNYLLSVANYSSIKNQIKILNEFYKLNQKDYDMVFIGSKENSYYKKLLKENQKLLKKYKDCGKVYFKTNIDRNEIPQIVEESKLYIVASTYEEYSISIIEALSKGIPVISTNVGNARELPGVITVEDSNNIHKAIKELLENEYMYKEYSEQGKKYATEKCKIDYAVRQLSNIISKERKR